MAYKIFKETRTLNKSINYEIIDTFVAYNEKLWQKYWLVGIIGAENELRR